MCSTASFRPATQPLPKDPEDLKKERPMPHIRQIRVRIRFREKGYDEFMDYFR